MPNIRIKFSKLDTASYLSHLDVMRTFMRDFKRADIRLRYTEGFNPHAYLSIAHPLPVGFTSTYEILDSEILDENTDDLIDRLNTSLPVGIEAISLYIPESGIKAIKFAEYLISYTYYGSMPEDTVGELNSFFKQANIPAEKRSKKGIKVINLADHFESLVFTQVSDTKIEGKLLLKVEEAPLNPRYFTEAIQPPELKPDFSHYHRISYLDMDKREFV